MPGVEVSKEALDGARPHPYKEGMDEWLLAVTSDPAAKGLAKDLKVAGAGPVHCHSPFFPYHV